MVTTRSADKRTNQTKEDLVLRARAITDPVSAESTPTASSRKRATKSRTHVDNGRQKRVRTGLDGIDDIDLDLEHHSQDTVTSIATSAGGSNHNTRSKEVQVVIPPQPDSTPKASVGTRSPSIEEQPSSAKSSTTVQAYLTPRTPAHRRFDSEELEDDSTIVVAPPGTDSTVHQEYQTADEEISDSDEAPEVETTKTPSARPRRAVAGRTPRGKKKTNVPETTDSDDVKVVAGVGVAAVQARVDERDGETATEAHLADDAEHIAEEEPADLVIETPITVPEPHSHPTPPPNDEAADNSEITILPSAPSDPEPEPIPVPTTTTSPPTTEPQPSTSHTATPNTITKFDSQPPAHQSTISSPHSHSNQSKPPQSLPSSSQRIHLRALNDKTIPSSTLPAKKRTTLSDHRRALLEQRAQRSGGAFKLQANWAKKRAAFAA